LVKKLSNKLNNLIIGGAGYTGSVLVKDLLSHNQKVTVIDNFMYDKSSLNSLKKNPNLKIINSEISGYKQIKTIIKDFDYIYPLSGLVGDPVCKIDKKLTIKYNVDSLKYLLESPLNRNVKIIYPSSCSVYGLLKKPADETSILNPQSLYAETKIECENILRNYKKENLIILRLPTIYGFSLRNRFDLVVNKMTYDITKKSLISVFNPNSKRPLLSVNDLSKIYINAQNIKNRFITYNIGSEKNNLSLEQIAREIVKVLKNQIANPKIEYHDEIDDNRSYTIILKRFKKDFDFKNFTMLKYEVLNIFKYLKSKNKTDFSSKKFHNKFN
tara:strand:+ start:835 stop:1818 length:984 start_codon:yes stop_codon:yes gene_type:complete